MSDIYGEDRYIVMMGNLHIEIASLNMIGQWLTKSYEADSSITNQQIEFKDWVEEKTEKYPQFKFWSIALKLELAVLQLVESLREGNFALYIQILGQLSPWMFALDHINYARWLPDHIQDMIYLKDIHPTVHNEF